MYILFKVEGEMDKLSVEEAGFLNCISVPSGAPSKVSTDTVPSIEKVLFYTNSPMPVLCALHTFFLTVPVMLQITNFDLPFETKLLVDL